MRLYIIKKHLFSDQALRFEFFAHPTMQFLDENIYPSTVAKNLHKFNIV